MKKLYTLFAFLTVFMGANAANWVEIYTNDYSKYDGFPYYVMGYVPEWFDGVMTDFGAMYGYKTDDEMRDDFNEVGTVTTNGGGATYHKVELTEAGWHQYFIADGIPTQLDGTYKVVALVKASEPVTININMGWSWTEDPKSASVSIGTEWEEVEWEYSGIGSTSCNLVAQPGTATATIEWKSLKVYEDQRAVRPTVWQQWLTNDGNSIIPDEPTESKYVGDAETAWPDWALELTDGINANWRTDRAPEICAWSLTMGRNFDDQCADFGEKADRARPYPADIEAEAGNESNHVFAVHVEQIDCIDDCEGDKASTAWSNQFWIQSPKSWKAGTTVRIKFRYKAEHACSAGTQWHKKNPSVYLHYNAFGDVNFTTEWQEFDKTVSLGSDANGAYSLAFNLCSDATNGRTPNVFYFDDLSWETMKLDEGLFVASCNTSTGLEYDFDNAAEFAWDDDLSAYVATVGEEGKQDTWVNEVMISTIRGNDASFKGATLKPSGTIVSGEDEWLNYTEASLAKIKLPSAGVWQIAVDTENMQMNFLLLEGDAPQEPLEEIPNPTEVVVKGLEREPTASEQPADEEAGIEAGTGQPWDNQFFIVANRTLSTGERTIVKFRYKSSAEAARTSTQLHGNPGAYMHWGAIGDVNFTNEWQDFEYTLEVPSEADGMKSIAFNMAEIKEACDYYITDIIWMTEDHFETLINTEGAENFYVKEGAGTDPYIFGTDPNEQGISSAVAIKPVNTVTFNLAGQRVANGYKGIVVKNGSKQVVK